MFVCCWCCHCCLVHDPPTNTPVLCCPCSCSQIAGATEFSLDVATAVLRCYQLQPSTANKELIAKTLLRALMQLPRPDYKICLQLLPEKLVVSCPACSGSKSAQHLNSSMGYIRSRRCPACSRWESAQHLNSSSDSMRHSRAGGSAGHAWLHVCAKLAQGQQH